MAVGAGPAVSARGVTKSFGQLRVLDGLDVDIPRGVTYCLLGPNGSGKTTFIRAIVRLLRLDAGELRVLDQPVSRVEEIYSRIGYMTQHKALYPDLTAEENMEFYSGLYGIKGQDREVRIEELLRMVDLSEHRKRLAGALSGGMYQRLSLACTLVHRPELLLLDEPTVGIDPRLRKTFWEYFQSMAEAGKTVIITTHLMDEAERCQMVGYMRAGRMAAQGSPEEILNQAGLGPRLRLWLAQPEDDAILLQSLGFEAEIDGGVVTVTLKSHAGMKRPKPERVGVVALRVVRQLKRDRRTIGLILFAPVVLMILFGYALSGEMTGVQLGLVDGGGHEPLRDYIASLDDFDILYLGSQSDAEKLISEGRLDGAVVIQPEEVGVLLDSSSLQISERVMAAVQTGVSREVSIRTDSYPPIITRYIFGYDLEMIDTIGPAILGLVAFFFAFIIAAISFLRERTLGTLEKFMVSPLSRVEIVSGYILGFSLVAIIQSATTLLIVIYLFGVPMKGSPLDAFAIILLLGAGALALGSFVSNFARSEFQVVQFIPIVIIPQIVLCGVFWPVQSVPGFLRPISNILPLTYASDALRAIMLKGASLYQILPDLIFLGAFFMLMFIAATLMLKREVG
ncbi:ABC transporter permease [Methanothrix sp.]|nr:ABC transporter permease [Methanothrix sp.]